MDDPILAIALTALEVDELYGLIQTELDEMDVDEDPKRKATLEQIQEKLL